jgi:hypothetical protein
MMHPMKTAEARQLGDLIAADLRLGQVDSAHAQLSPILSQRIHFNMLEKIGERLYPGACKENWAVTLQLIRRIVNERPMGGWVIVGCLLRDRFGDAPGEAFAICQGAILTADVWYATDILGERLPGPALLTEFNLACGLLEPWRVHSNHWIRRTVGVAVHFWTKRCRDDPAGAARLLDFLAPMFEERDVDAIKGVGWGLKTLGRYYPDLLVGWLQNQRNMHRQPRRLMLRKALTYLPPHLRTGLELDANGA